MPNTTEQIDAVKEARELLRTGAAAKMPFIHVRPELLKTLADEVERLRKQVKQMKRDAREDARDVAAEARWQERQGEDYGTY